MTQVAVKQFKELRATTAKYSPQVKEKTTQPFASSAAKYYPALKKLASK